MSSTLMSGYWPPIELDAIYDFSTPFAQRRGPRLHRKRTRYSEIWPFRRRGVVYERNREVVVRRRSDRSSPTDPQITFPASTYSQTSEVDPSELFSFMGFEPIYIPSNDIYKKNVCDTDEEETSSVDLDAEDEEEFDEVDLTFLFDNTKNVIKKYRLYESYLEDNVKLPRSFRREEWQKKVSRAKLLSAKLIKHARSNKLPLLEDLLCPDCKLIPMEPVSGQCGHTRCNECILSRGSCPCGMPQPQELHVNTLIKNIIEKMLEHYNLFDAVVLPEPAKKVIVKPIVDEPILPIRLDFEEEIEEPVPRHFTITMEDRFDMAKRLVKFGYHFAATPHLAHVAATSGRNAKEARLMLDECSYIANKTQHCRYSSRKLFHYVRTLSATSWLDKKDIECILCIDSFKDPVTTYCGHTYCRNCLLRSINYSTECPLCKRSLLGMDVYDITETLFINSILYSFQNDRNVTLDPELVPFLMCTVAYPSVPCPLLIFDARYWQSLHRLLNDERREFGMVARHKDNDIPEYGTMLEIRDCVHLRNGGCILTTVGTYRFKIIDTDHVYGCDVARIKRLTDDVPEPNEKISHLRDFASVVALKANMWLERMDKRVRAEINSVYGNMPKMEVTEDNWWNSNDGPEWMWWLLSVLPLNSQMKTLILTAQCVRKRLYAIDLTLNTVHDVYQLQSAEKDIMAKAIRQYASCGSRSFTIARE